MSQYQVLILPNTTRFYFNQVFSILEHYGRNAVVITLDPQYLLSECPEFNTRFISRINEDGTVLSNTDLLNRVCEVKPHVLVLDDCFWEQDDGLLLNCLLEIQKKLPPFNIVNVVQFSSPMSWKNLLLAHRIRFPISHFQSKMFQLCSYPLTLYENEEDLTPRSNTILLDSPSSPKIYIQIFKLYQLLHNIRCLTEMDIFCMFLRQLNHLRQNKHLLHFFIETRKYSIYGEILPNKELSSKFISEYITVINHIVLNLVQSNEPIFHEILGFFSNQQG